MKLYSDYLKNILKRNLGFRIINDPDLGMLFELKPIEAYRYVVLTGSGYLNLEEPELRTFSKRDVFRVFNQAQQFDIQLGVFDDNDVEFKYDSRYFFDKYPFILNGKKYILFLDFIEDNSSGEPSYYDSLRKINKIIVDKGENPNNYVVSLVDEDNRKDLESFFEYFVCDYFARRGFFTDSQIPFYYGVGTPDIAAFSLPELSNLLEEKYGISGCTTFELMNLKLLNDLKSLGQNDTNKNFVFEVKTTSTNGSQIKKYIDKDVFDKAYEMIPHKKRKSDYAGLFHFTDDGELLIEESKDLSTKNKSLFNDWLSTYFKMYLLHNFTKAQFEDFKKNNNINTNADLIRVLRSLSFRDLIDLFDEEK